MKITVTILTKNCQVSLRETLLALKEFAEVLILDTGSTDSTLAIAQEFPNTVIHHSPFLGFGPTHNKASSLASHDWILSIDSDEILSEELCCEILKLSLDPGSVYSLDRHNYYRGRHIKWCGGWYPDRIVRLYHRGQTAFNDAAVHEKILTQGLKVIPLKGPLLHTPYRTMDDFLSKMQTYSSLFAIQHAGKKKSSLLLAIAHGLCAFCKSYFFKKGFLGGKEGFIISAYNGHTAFYKYLKLAEKNKDTKLPTQ
jgi:glycosyltransferase involved in cell wall biosynthesis